MNSIMVDNPCLEQKGFCINCNSHFMKIRPSIKSVAISKRFLRDLKDEEKAAVIIKDVLDCSHLDFHELHKFERNIGGNLFFRAKKENLHIVYGIDGKLRIVFLRAIRNFNEYRNFLRDRKELIRIMRSA